MNIDTDNTAALHQQDHDALFEARDKLTRIKDLNELVSLAGEGMLGMSRKSAMPYALAVTRSVGCSKRSAT